MADEMTDMRAGIVVCRRCSAHGGQPSLFVGRLGGGEQRLMFWFCSRCLGVHDDAPSAGYP